MLMEISQDKRQRAIMRSRKMYETDMMSRMLTERDAGKSEGRLEAQRDFVRNMYQGGFTVAEIIRATMLSEQDVNELLSSNAG